jgi:hypothetical protein
MTRILGILLLSLLLSIKSSGQDVSKISSKFFYFINTYQLDSLESLLDSDFLLIRQYYLGNDDDKFKFLNQTIPDLNKFNSRYEVLESYLGTDRTSKFIVEEQGEFQRIHRFQPLTFIYTISSNRSKLTYITIDTTNGFTKFYADYEIAWDSFIQWVGLHHSEVSIEGLLAERKLILAYLKEYENDSIFCFRKKTDEYIVSYLDTTSGNELIGQVVIKAKFPNVYTDTFYSMAIVNINLEWVCIDKYERIILKPFIYDNGPDYIQEGLFRFVENNKIGFANSDGRKIIMAKYDFATPFKNGISNYTKGGQREYDKGGEHWWWTGGYESGYINQDGTEFIRVTKLKKNNREVWTKDKKHYILNTNGQIIKRLK